ncbi:hypothetical protein WR25_25216 [Diploscapter pachys]|uniref:Uncharacterized protein n=1 Tax=Diploscapter pachys TaxID=2018661 RepID=A0A2A2KF60_9BILA|nr:hypothetical protein WR25_25216 [Diploscapter pachys]
MGRDKSESKKSRKRSRSRERDRDRRRGRSRSNEPKRGSDSRSASSQVQKMKEKMQTGLKQAKDDIAQMKERSEDERKPVSTSSNETYSFSEMTYRSREIERIEDGDFRPAQFKSSRDQATKPSASETREQKEERNISEHERAMFGPMWASNEMKTGMVKKEKGKEIGTKDIEMSLPPEPR